jgi:hypothetical protein
MGSVKKGRRVAYAVQGSPAFHCGTAVRLYRLARTRGFAAIMVSGISSLELLTAQLSELHDLTDLQVYGARHIARGASIDPTVPCLLFDLGRFALPVVRGSAKSLLRARLAELQTRLGMIYPQDHLLLLMRIADDGTCHTRKTRLHDLSASLTVCGPSVTIFIQALDRGSVRWSGSVRDEPTGQRWRQKVDNAIDGDTRAARECFDRMDGKVAQSVNATGQVRGDVTFTWKSRAN